MKRFILLFILFPHFCFSQWENKPSKIYQRMMLGGDVAVFRISLDDFDQVYKNRWDFSYGGFIGYRAFRAYYITFKYGIFQQSGNGGQHPITHADMTSARWDERWYKLGARLHPTVEKKWGSYYGFGIAAFTVKENETASLFENDNIKTGTGFYLELGIDYFITTRSSLFFEIEITSGRTEGRSILSGQNSHSRGVLESMSVGGWRFSFGLSFWPL